MLLNEACQRGSMAGEDTAEARVLGWPPFSSWATVLQTAVWQQHQTANTAKIQGTRLTRTSNMITWKTQGTAEACLLLVFNLKALNGN